MLDSILADRIHRVRFDYLKVFEKIHIIDNYLVPSMLNTIIGFESSSIKITKEALLFIIKNYTYEAGVRKLKERVLEIIRQINLECIYHTCDNSSLSLESNSYTPKTIFRRVKKLLRLIM